MTAPVSRRGGSWCPISNTTRCIYRRTLRRPWTSQSPGTKNTYRPGAQRASKERHVSPQAIAPSGEFRSEGMSRVLYGPGRVEELPAQVDRLGGKRAFVITGQSLATKTDLVRSLEGLLGQRHCG